jgi:glycosyltransferase involved in cell wall biosynthesis
VPGRSLFLIVPGRLDTATGGYAYDRRMVVELRTRGWRVNVCEIEDSFPHPTSAALEHAGQVLDGIPSGTTVVVDGLAFGAMPQVVERHAGRLRLMALVHHPLAEETGITPEAADRLRASETRALAKAVHVIVTSRATATLLASYGVGADRIAVIEPGTDRALPAVGSGGKTTQILCVAAVIPRKRHDLLVRALTTAAAFDWHLTCVGSMERDRDAANRLRAQVRAAALEDRVTLVGEIEPGALGGYYHHADLFVLASQHEGYGMVVAEALARGLPIVATDTGAARDLLSGDTPVAPGSAAAGILVPPGDEGAMASALCEVLSDPSRRLSLAAGARRVRDLLPTWAASADRLASALQALSDG